MNDSTPSGVEKRVKRKKTSRACIHCQKAHVTCDPGRPCKRCIKRGYQDTCRDGVRKKAKYLEGDCFAELSGAAAAAAATTSSTSGVSPGSSVYFPPGEPSVAEQNGGILPSLSSSLPLTPPDGPQNQNQSDYSATALTQQQVQGADHSSPYTFGSRATNLEYSILSNILQASGDGLSPYDGSQQQQQQQMPSSNIAISDQPHLLTQNQNQQSGVMPYNPVIQQQPQQHQEQQQQHTMYTPVLFPEIRISETNPADSQVFVANYKYHDPEAVYSQVVSPFPYTQGFHRLLSYLRSRFSKTHLMHIARAMAAYRPSFIAATNLLKEADLIFMEQCFQRTLMEIQKYIPSSGTPTVVWRRTGQIAAVGKEFCVLTGWAPQDLVENTRFIVELMDDTSVIDYFDVFSKLAFGDSRGVTMTECTLLNPMGVRIPTACTWTVKRDVFDIPMMIIGNFLPIL